MPNQILNVESMAKYKPDQYTKTSSGAVMLNEGIAPIEGTTKQVPAIDTTVISSTNLIDTPETIEAINAAKNSKQQGLDAAYQRTLSGTANATDKANLDYAIKSGIYKTPQQSAMEAAELEKKNAEIANIKTQAATPTGATTGAGAENTNKTLSALDTLIQEKTKTIGTPVDISGYKTAADEASVAVEQARQAIANKNVLDAVTLKQFENRVIPMSAILGQQSQYTAAQAIPNLLATQDYNNKVIMQKLAAGQLLEAQNMNQSIANDVYEIQKLQIEEAKEQDRIDENDQARLDEQAKAERDLALKYGFIKITGPSGLKGLTEDQIMRVPNPITGNIDIYRKPEGMGITEPDISVIGQRMVDDGLGGKIQQNIYGYYDTKTGDFKEVNVSGGYITSTDEGTTGVSGFNFDDYLSRISGGTVTQSFDTPTDYIAGRTTHGGYDIAGEADSPIQAPVSGKIVEITKDNGKGTGWGNSVVIQDEQGNKWRLGHFNNVTVGMGENVYAGQIAGYLGNTGKVMGEGGGYHLHIEAKDANGNLIDIKGGQVGPKISSITKNAINDPEYFRTLNSKQKAVVNKELADSGLTRKVINEADIESYGREYAATGIIPKNLPEGSFSEVAEYTRKLPKLDGKIYNVTTGTTPKDIPANEQDDLARLSTITSLTDKLLQLDKKRWGGVISGTLGKLFGDSDQGEYLSIRKAITDEITRMQTGAALSESEQVFYGDYLPGRFSESFFLGQDSEKKIQNFDNIIKNRLNGILQTQGIDIIGRKMNINVDGKEVNATRVFRDGEWGWEY